jgi:hypothetical protein
MNEHEIELRTALDDMDRQREDVEKRLIDVMEVVEALKSQVSSRNVALLVSILESSSFLHLSNRCKSS